MAVGEKMPQALQRDSWMDEDVDEIADNLLASIDPQGRVLNLNRHPLVSHRLHDRRSIVV
jgi:hypothetical protein